MSRSLGHEPLGSRNACDIITDVASLQNPGIITVETMLVITFSDNSPGLM